MPLSSLHSANIDLVSAVHGMGISGRTTPAPPEEQHSQSRWCPPLSRKRNRARSQPPRITPPSIPLMDADDSCRSALPVAHSEPILHAMRLDIERLCRSQPPHLDTQTSTARSRRRFQFPPSSSVTTTTIANETTASAIRSRPRSVSDTDVKINREHDENEQGLWELDSQQPNAKIREAS